MTAQSYDAKGTVILRQKQVSERTGLSRSAIYDKMKLDSPRYDPSFPRQVSIGKASVGWKESDIEQWLASRVYASNVSNKDLRGSVIPNEAMASFVKIEQSQPADTPRSELRRLATPSENIAKEKTSESAPTLPSFEASPVQTSNPTESLNDQVSRGTTYAPEVLAVNTQVPGPTSIAPNGSGRETGIEKMRLADARRIVAEHEKKCVAAARPILEDYARQGFLVHYDDVMKAIDLSPDSADDCALFDKILEDL